VWDSAVCSPVLRRRQRQRGLPSANLGTGGRPVRQMRETKTRRRRRWRKRPTQRRGRFAGCNFSCAAQKVARRRRGSVVHDVYWLGRLEPAAVTAYGGEESSGRESGGDRGAPRGVRRGSPNTPVRRAGAPVAPGAEGGCTTWRQSKPERVNDGNVEAQWEEGWRSAAVRASRGRE
jgi:hypothetical protein